ncbi:MAG: hypothetical protein AAF649_13215 [Verrucomicrobiota bacterium]
MDPDKLSAFPFQQPLIQETFQPISVSYRTPHYLTVLMDTLTAQPFGLTKKYFLSDEMGIDLASLVYPPGRNKWMGLSFTIKN